MEQWIKSWQMIASGSPLSSPQVEFTLQLEAPRTKLGISIQRWMQHKLLLAMLKPGPTINLLRVPTCRFSLCGAQTSRTGTSTLPGTTKKPWSSKFPTTAPLLIANLSTMLMFVIYSSATMVSSYSLGRRTTPTEFGTSPQERSSKTLKESL
jgi:hypothetical protein